MRSVKLEDLAAGELRRDPVFPWLSEAQQKEYLANAIAIGMEQAGRFQGRPVRSLLAELGARYLIGDEAGCVAGDERAAGDKPPSAEANPRD